MHNALETLTFPLLAADFDYFRIPRERWELMLARLRQMGLSAVTLTVPWYFHEFERGQIDFSGTTNPRRNVMAVLELSGALGFSCILKPGPYSSAGILGDGLPAWLYADPDSLDTALPGAVEGWFTVISQALLRWQEPHGPIIALQVESEAGLAAPLANKQLTEVNWRIWLRKRYGGIETLNAAYGTAYHTVNEVKFPASWAAASTPLEQDAQAFLASVRQDIQAGYIRLLVNAGWHVPVYPVTEPALPAIGTVSLTAPDMLAGLDGQLAGGERRIINFQQPIQVDPDPVDIGCGPTWADGAPIRPDGTVQPEFWAIREYIWRQTLPGMPPPDPSKPAASPDYFMALVPGGGLITSRQPVSIKIPIPPNIRPAAYRLHLSGHVLAAETFKFTRGRLSGIYPAGHVADPVDLIFFVNEEAAPLDGFFRAYLGSLLAAQVSALNACAAGAERLGAGLAVPEAAPGPAAPAHPARSAYTLTEAQRGLREADAALRKAMTSIGNLETGFGIILGKNEPVLPRPAATPLLIPPQFLEGAARDILVEVGRTCAGLAPSLQAAAQTLQQTLQIPGGFTVEQYRLAHEAARAAAGAGRELLLPVIARLRLESATGKLLLFTSKVHNEVQEISEGLHWGVLRGARLEHSLNAENNA